MPAFESESAHPLALRHAFPLGDDLRVRTDRGERLPERPALGDGERVELDVAVDELLEQGRGRRARPEFVLAGLDALCRARALRATDPEPGVTQQPRSFQPPGDRLEG